MGTTNYWVRAEYEDKTFEDFQVSSEDRINAQIKSEQRIRLGKNLPTSTNFRWHGMVVFVNPKQETVS